MEFLAPFAGTDTCFAGESVAENFLGREATSGGNFLDFEVGLLGHESFGFLDAVAVDELIEGAAELITEEAREVGAVHGQDSTEVHELEIRVEVGLGLTHP